MFLGDLMRRDTVLLHLMASTGGPTGSGELVDALSAVGVDADAKNLLRELKRMEERALITFSGYTLRHTGRMRLYELTDLGRASLNRRLRTIHSILHEPPVVRDTAAQQRAAGWT